MDRVIYVPTPQGQVLGASTENGSPQEYATVQQFADLQQQINALAHAPQQVFVPSFTGPAPTTPVNTATFAQSQRIDNLSGTSLSNITVSGVSGLTDADIPDSITVAGTGASQWTTSGSDIYYNTGNVGIGTTTPWGRLSIKGAGTGTGKALVITDSSNVERMVVQDNGNVGIGKTNPAYMLDVVGQINSDTGGGAGAYRIQGGRTLYGDGVYSYVGNLDASRILRLVAGGSTAVDIVASGNVGIGTSTPWGKLSITQTGTAGAPSFIVEDSASPDSSPFIIDQTGNVGIGDSTPSYKLDVNGFVNVDGTTGGYKQAGNTILYASSTLFSIFVGASSGNTSHTGTTNVGVGVSSLTALTTGSNNVAVGAAALLSTTDGQYNVGVGRSALRLNTSGLRNVALGTEAMYNATSTSNNVVIGYEALDSMITGPSNDSEGSVVIGYNAGTNVTYGGSNILLGYQAGDALTTGSHNLVLGYDIDAPSATDDNQLNIGNILFGTNVNSTGTTVDTDANIGIGTTTPWGKFAVHGFSGTSVTGTPLIGNFYSAAGTGGVIQVGGTTGTGIFGTDGNGDTYIWSPGASQDIRLAAGNAERVRIDLTGNVGIGTTTPYALLSISNSKTTAANTPLFVIASTTGGTATTTVLSVASTGDLTVVGSVVTCTIGNGSDPTSCSSASDQRLKDNVTGLDVESTLAAIKQLDPVSFLWNSYMVGNGASTSTQYGFIAQDVAKVFPNLVAQDAHSGYFKLNYRGSSHPL